MRPRALCCASLPLRAGAAARCSNVERCFVRGRGKAVNKRLTRGIGWLTALMMCCLMLVVVPTSAWAVEDNSLPEVYVSMDGNDETGDGSAEKPVATLKRALELVADEGTVYVTTPLTVKSMARIDGKSATIDGAGNTVTRAEGFGKQNDARGGYNPAMIEVANGATLTLVDIKLNDAFRREADEFLEQPTTPGVDKGNESKVQDAIIAAYDGGEGSGNTVILGSGATLENFGGMSAVRIGGKGKDAPSSSKLVMRTGGKIVDTDSARREGGVAAIWNQGGIVEIESGAEIAFVDGRAIYQEDGSTAVISGSIHDVTSNAYMTANPGTGGDKGVGAEGLGFAGMALAQYGGSQATLSSGATIYNIMSDNNTNTDVVVFGVSGCTFTMESGSSLTGSEGQGISIVDTNGMNVYIDGKISGFNSKNALIRTRNNIFTFEIGEHGVIENCSCDDAALIYVQGSDLNLNIKGTLRNLKTKGSTTPVLFIAHTAGTGGTCAFSGTLEDIEGAGLYNSKSTNRLIVSGGTIRNCSGYAVKIETKDSSRPVATITSDSVIEGNNKGRAQVYVSTAKANDEYEHVKIEKGAIKGNTTIDLVPFDVTLDADYETIGLGNASSTVSTAIKGCVNAEHSNWTVIGSRALWLQPSKSDVHFSIERSYSMKNTTMYAALMPLNEDGSPVSDAEVMLQQVKNADPVDVTFSGLTPNQSYAMMLVNTDIYRLAPDDVTKYIGGGQGNEDNYDETGGFPQVTFANCLDKITSMTIDNEDVDGDYLQALFSLLEVTYTDADENPVISDREPGEYIVHLAWKNSPAPSVRINENDVDTALGTGRLIVRHIENTDEAQSGANTHELLTDEPMGSVEHAEAIANGKYSWLGPVFYTNDDEGREVDAGGIQLLDDDLLKYDGEDRTTPMEDKGDSHLGSAGEGKEWSYEFHYLDLVDAYNGNAWVSASYGTTIYLPYPEGITAANASKLGVTVIHYKDLHREYGITGQDDVEDAIAACEMETMKVELTEQGIKFDTERAGFSPFAIAWKTDASEEPDQPVTPPLKHYTITASAGEGGSISPSGTVSVAAGADKTFTFTPDEGNRVADVIVDGESLGALGSYTFEDVASDHTIQVVFKPGNAPADPDDTGVSDWLNTKDHDVYLHGYQDGSNTFKPNGNMTRGEVACMFYNLLLDKSMGDTPVAFEDVPESAFYAGPIRVLASRGILFGTSPTTFDPDRPITRAEFTAIAMRFSKGDLSGENIFVDVAEGAWYYDVIVGSIKYGWIYGYQDRSHRFGPDDTITRAEATCIANRMLGRLPDGAYIAEHKNELKLFSDVSEEHFAWRDIIEATNAHDYVKDGGYEDWTSLKDEADA